MSPTARWTVVRHAESTANAARLLCGQHDAPLSERGQQQARALAATLADDRFHRVVGSDLVRVRQTAAPLLCGRTLRPLWLPELRERNLGTWSHRTIDEARRTLDVPDWSEAVLSWHGAPPQGESWQQLAERVLTALASLDAPGHTLVVSHAAVMRVLCGLLEQQPKSQIPLRRLAHLEVIRLELPLGTWLRLLRQVQEHR